MGAAGRSHERAFAVLGDRCLDVASTSDGQARPGAQSKVQAGCADRRQSFGRQNVREGKPNTHRGTIGGPRRLEARRTSSPLTFRHSAWSLKSKFDELLIAPFRALGGVFVDGVAGGLRHSTEAFLSSGAAIALAVAMSAKPWGRDGSSRRAFFAPGQVEPDSKAVSMKPKRLFPMSTTCLDEPDVA